MEVESMTRRTPRQALAGVASILLAAAATSAQDAAPTPTSQPAAPAVEEITVTARKVTENIQDVPIAVSAFTGDQLEQLNAVEVDDIASFTPGFSVRPHPGNQTALTLQMRGQIQSDILATLEPSVGVYVDEMYWARAYGLNTGLLDIANAQALKGPQGTLFGRNTTGGALLLNSNDPSLDGFSGSASVSYGRYNEASGEVVLNVPAGERVALRGAFRIATRDGWAYGVRSVDPATGFPNNTSAATNVIERNGKHYNDRDELQGRLKLLFQLSDSVDLLLSGEWWNSETDGYARQMLYKVQLNNPFPPNPAGDDIAFRTPVNKYIAYQRGHPNAVGIDAFDCAYSVTQPPVNCLESNLRDDTVVYTQADTQTYLAKLRADVGVGELKLITGFRSVFTDGSVDLDGSSSHVHTTTLQQDLEQWSIEGQFTGSLFGERLDYATGVTVFGEDGYDQSYSLSSRPSGDRRNNATRNYGAIDNQSWGIYGQLNWHVLEALTLTGGVRYSDDKKELDIRSANVNLAGVPTALAPGAYVPGGLTDPCNAAGNPSGIVGVATITGATPANDCSAVKSADFEDVSWTVGLDYRITDDLMVYGKASHGDRSGGHNLRAFNDAQFVPFQEETVDEQEIGLKSELLDGRVRFNLAAYHNRLSDAQRSSIVQTSGVNNTIIGNAAKVENWGVELDSQLRPLDGLTIVPTFSWQDVSYDKYADASGDRSGERLGLVPAYLFSLFTEYRMQISAVSAAFSFDYTWTDRTPADRCTAVGDPVTDCFLGGDANGLTPLEVSQDIVSATTLPPGGVLGVRATFGFAEDRYKLTLWGRNVTDNRDR
jgi:iron complex outermembrane receptor protein